MKIQRNYQMKGFQNKKIQKAVGFCYSEFQKNMTEILAFVFKKIFDIKAHIC